MKTTVDFGMFADSFARVNRMNFSHNGLMALYIYLAELELDTGDEIELDPDCFCCKYTEYAGIDDAADDYGITPEELFETTLVITSNGGVIVENF